MMRAPLGLSGAEAALPIWADFMRAALLLTEPGDLPVPPTVGFRRVCDSLFREAFLALTELETRARTRRCRGPGATKRWRAIDEPHTGPPLMALGDLFLRAQGVIDRLVRRLRLGRAPTAGRRRLLVVQIDGLSRAVLDQALARGEMPFLRRLLALGGHRLTPMTVGIPTSTPAFQMAMMFGIRPDIPGFHYYDKRRRTDIHFPRAGHAAFVEADQARGRPGILQGGSVYGCVFTGGAVHDFFSFTRLTRPRASGVVRVLSAAVVIAWVAAKSAAMTCNELLRVLGRIARRPSQGRSEWRWFKKHIAICVWTREWFTFAVARDAYDGVPAIYVNYLDHDETGHAFGPRSRQAFQALRGVDSSLRQIQRVLRRVPGHQYDLYILSDHGQAPCTPYRVATGGRRFERAFFDQVPARLPGSAAARTPTDSPVEPSADGIPATAAGRSATGDGSQLELGFEPYLDVRESHERDGLRVVSAGPNAFVYFVDTPEPVPLEAIEARCPGLATTLSKSPGVGFVLARSANGPVCFWRGQCHPLAQPDGGPFDGRKDRAIVTRDLAALMTMRSAGDLVIYGTEAPEGHVSYIDEFGAHAGPSHEELHTFLVAPVDRRVPARIEHPVQLYEMFIHYQAPAPETAGASALGRHP
jgi:Type I phosphodiesterase / nucleotide pyrophosphatase